MSQGVPTARLRSAPERPTRGCQFHARPPLSRSGAWHDPLPCGSRTSDTRNARNGRKRHEGIEIARDFAPAMSASPIGYPTHTRPDRHRKTGRNDDAASDDATPKRPSVAHSSLDYARVRTRRSLPGRRRRRRAGARRCSRHAARPQMGTNVLIAWNCSTEQTRVTAFAMPVLKRASRVIVLTVEGGVAVPGPTGQQRCRYLQLNGVPAKPSWLWMTTP